MAKTSVPSGASMIVSVMPISELAESPKTSGTDSFINEGNSQMMRPKCSFLSDGPMSLSLSLF
jgi:hypothetical protein